MDQYNHLIWKVHTSLDWMADAPTSNQKFHGEGDHVNEVWIGKDSTSMRIFVPTIDANNKLFFVKQEIELHEGYAIMQFYDCGTQKADGVCFIQVVPTFGDSRTTDVNNLQTGSTEAFTREMMMGKLPERWNGLKVDRSSNRYVFKTFDIDRKVSLTKNLPGYWFETKGDYSNGKLSGIEFFNGFDGHARSKFSNLIFEDEDITGFTRSDETKQCLSLKIPRSVVQYSLEKKDNGNSDMSFKQGARVFDFRECGAVPLGQFPDKSCQPKTYKWTGRLANLNDQSIKTAGYVVAPSNTTNKSALGFGVVVVLATLVFTFTLRGQKALARKQALDTR